jgi:hypothetical protein
LLILGAQHQESVLKVLHSDSVMIVASLLMCSAPLSAQQTDDRAPGSPPHPSSAWQCRDLTPARAGAHLRYEFRLGGTIAASADTSLGDAHRVVELAFDRRGEMIQFRDRAPVTAPTPGFIELAGVRDAYGALSAREWTPTIGGGTRTRELAAAEVDAVLRTARAFWDQRCSA